MSVKKTFSVSKNLTVSLVIITFVLSASFIALYSYQLMDREKDWLQQSAEHTLTTIVSSLEMPLWNLDTENIAILCLAYFQNEIIVSLELRGFSGELLFSRSREKNSQDREITRKQKIYHQDVYLGEVIFTLSPVHLIKTRLKIIRASIAALSITSLVLIIFTGFFLNKFLKEPLESLTKIARSYTQGDYHPEFKDASYKEFEQLKSLLIEMGNTIDLQMQKLQQAEEVEKKHSEHLEKMVQQRTLELKESNVELQKEILERKVIQKNLKANEQRLNAILKASPIGIGLVVERKLNWANETMYQMVGYDYDDLQGIEARVLYTSPDKYDQVGKELYTSIERFGLGSVETKWIRRDGTIFDCMIRACHLDASDPELGQIVAAVDISKEKQLESKLQQAEKMKAVGTLAGGVAHDLNNILSGIVSYPEMLLLDLPEDSALRKPLITIQKSGEKAVMIVQDLLTMARRGVPGNEIVNLNDIISEQLKSPEMEKLNYFHPDLEITTQFETNLLNIKGSSIHLSKSIMNLVSNAAEAMPDGGKLRISTSNIYLDAPVKGYEAIKEGDYVKIIVADTGIGLSTDEVDRIFEPFYTKKKMGRSGTGLGMAVVWGTIKDHNGYIDVISEKGVGTSFEMYFPITREEIEPQNTDLPVEEYSGNQESILIVDDVEEQREIAGMILRRLGYIATSVCSGEDAIAYVQDHEPPDLILLDMIMAPGIDGLEAYQKISEINPGQKAIIASGYSKTERVKEIQKLGVKQYIRKPYTLAKIGAAIKKELGSSHSV